MRNSKTLEFMNSLNEKINKDNIEINKAIANPNLGRNQDRIKQAGYDIQYDGDYIKNPKTGKGVWPKDYSRDEKKKVDFKGRLDSERKNIPTTRRFAMDIKDNKIPKSARLNKNDYNRDEVEFYSPTYNDESKKSVSSTINTYKKAVKDRDEAKSSAEYNKKSLGYYEKKVKDAQKDLDFQKNYIKGKEKEADWAENKRKEIVDKARARKTSTVKEGAEPIIKGLKKKLKESVDEDFVNNAYDLIGDYLYNETGRDEVSWGEIKDYIYNDVCDDELHDYNPSKETMEAIKQRLKNGGYKVLEEQEKAAIEKEIDKLTDKMKETPIKDLTGEEAHKIEKLEKKLKDETLTEARQEEILSKLPKKKIKESEEVYSEQGEEQQLNEETVGEKITSPSGKFWIGDPCYVLSDDIYYGIWDDKYNFEDGIIDCGNGLSFLVHRTAYGDGSYQGTNGAEYGVDSGTLAIIPMDLVAKTDGVQFGSVETSNTAWLDYNDGTFDITLDNGSFSIITSEEDEEEDGPWDPEEYDDQDNWDDDEYRPGDDE